MRDNKWRYINNVYLLMKKKYFFFGIFGLFILLVIFNFVYGANSLSSFDGIFTEGFESNNFSINNWTLSATTFNWTISTTNPYSGNYYALAEPKDGSGSVLQTDLDTSNYMNINISFYAYTSGLDTNEYIAADWYNGTSWINLMQVEDIASYTFYNYSLPASANNNSNFKIRFRCFASNANEICALDNIQVLGNKMYSSFSNWNKTPSDLNTSVSGNILVNVSINDSNGVSNSRLYYNNSGDSTYAGILSQDPGYVNMTLVSGTNFSGVWQGNITHWFYRPSKYNLFIKDIEDVNVSYQNIYDGILMKVNFTEIPVNSNLSYRIDFYILNESSLSDDCSVYYCNSSYNSGDPINNDCSYIGGLEVLSPTLVYGRKALSFSLDNNSQINSVIATSNISIIFEASHINNTNDSWKIREQNITSGGHTYVSADNGTSWDLENDWESDVHIHWHDLANNQQFQYWAWANNSLNNSINSTLQYDIWESGSDSPSKPLITIPEGYTHYKDILNITWLSSIDPNGDAFTYNISLLNEGGTFNKTINGSVGQNFNYQIYNTSLSLDGRYKAKIEACDINNNCNFDTMINYFTIDNTLPQIQFIDSTISTGNYSFNYIFANVSAYDANFDNITIYLYNSTGLVFSNSSNLNFSVNYTDLSNGIYSLNATIFDLAENTNQTETRTIILDNILPVINSINATPNPVKSGQNITITANVTDSIYVDSVWFNLNGVNYTMIRFGEIWNYSYNTTDLDVLIYNYTIYANDSSNNLISSIGNFSVEGYLINFSMQNSSNVLFNFTCLIINSTGEIIHNDTGMSHTINLTKGFYEFRLIPINYSFKEIKFQEINVSKSLSQIIDIENSVDNFGYNKLYSFNPLLDNLTFIDNQSNLTITFTASNITNNKILYKCGDWNWTNQNCSGTWVPIQGIFPGEDYTFVMDNLSDPGLAEGNGTFFEGFEGTQADNQSNVGYDNAGWTIIDGGTWNPNDNDQFAGVQSLSAKNTGGIFAWNEINVSTQNYSSVRLSIYYKDSNNLEAGEFLSVDWYNGTTWITEVNVSNVGTYTLFNQTLSSNAVNNSNFKIRLGCKNNAANEFCYWDNVQITGQTNTCTYSGSGNWLVNCSDNCLISSNINLLGNNISITGTGIFSTTANITNFKQLFIAGTSSTNRCEVYCSGGGCFK